MLYEEVIKNYKVAQGRVFINIEPILDFISTFESDIYRMKPWAVAVEWDNYNAGLPEPSREKIEKLISALEENGIKVYRKTLRERNE